MKISIKPAARVAAVVASLILTACSSAPKQEIKTGPGFQVIDGKQVPVSCDVIKVVP